MKGFSAERLTGKVTGILKVGEGSFLGWVEFSAGQDGGPRTRGVPAEPEKEPGGWKVQYTFGEHPAVGRVPHSSAFCLARPAAALFSLRVPPPLAPACRLPPASPLLLRLLGNGSPSVTWEVPGRGETELLLLPLTELECPMPGALRLCPHPLPTWKAWRGHGMGPVCSLGWRESHLQLCQPFSKGQSPLSSPPAVLQRDPCWQDFGVQGRSLSIEE